MSGLPFGEPGSVLAVVVNLFGVVDIDIVVDFVGVVVGVAAVDVFVVVANDGQMRCSQVHDIASL
jgi:hypothetical protein